MGWRAAGQRPQSRPVSDGILPRASVTVHVDVAACIRWAGISLALVLLSLSLSGDQAGALLRSLAGRTPLFFGSAPLQSDVGNSAAELPSQVGADKVTDRKPKGDPL